MITLQELSTYVHTFLDINQYQDSSLNGMQVEATPLHSEVTKIGYAVDSGLSIIKKAIKEKCSLLIVHHGLFWGQSERISGILGEKIRLCITHGLSLYAAHLPLDGHQELGNARILSNLLGCTYERPFIEQGGICCGVWATTNKSFNELFISLKALTNHPSSLFISPSVSSPDSIDIRTKKEPKKVVIATGSAAFMIPYVKSLDADLFITGEPKQNAYHEALDNQLPVMFGGHYGTETFGVKALAHHLEKTFSIPTVEISEPTGI